MSIYADRSQRGTILLEDCEVVGQEAFDGDQFVIRVASRKIAAAVPMRRPLSIMRVDADEGWLEFLYKIVGDGLRHLASRRPGDTLSVMGPIGQPFRPSPDRPRPLLVGGGVGIPPMVFLAEALAGDDRYKPVVTMGSEIPFPFQPRPSGLIVPGMPDEAIACMPLLESWSIPSRLASWADMPGCYRGYVTDLAAAWLDSLDAEALNEVAMFACGPTPMLKSAAAVAERFGIPCQVSLEEYMACAVGGCAGCTVLVRTPEGPAMKRVCVDGPVFDAAAVF